MNASRILLGKYLKAFLLVGLISGASATPAWAQYGPLIAGAGPVNRSMGGAATAAPLSAGGALMWNAATLSGLEGSQIDVGAELLLDRKSVV